MTRALLFLLNSKLSYSKCVQCRYLAFQIYGPFLRQYGPQRLQKSWLLEVSRNDELKETWRHTVPELVRCHAFPLSLKVNTKPTVHGTVLSIWGVPFYLLGTFPGANCYCVTSLSNISPLLSANCYFGNTIRNILLLLIANCYFGNTFRNISLLLSANCYFGNTVHNILLLLRANCYLGITISNTAKSSCHLSLCHSSDLSPCNTLLSQRTVLAYCTFLSLLLSQFRLPFKTFCQHILLHLFLVSYFIIVLFSCANSSLISNHLFKPNQTTLRSILLSLVHAPPTQPHMSNSYKAQHNTIPIPLNFQLVLSTVYT